MDLPGIIEGAADGKGRGRQVIAVAKGCDLVLMVLDATKAEEQKRKLTKELEKVGLRLNKNPPNIKITFNKIGGVRVNSTCKLTRVTFFTSSNLLFRFRLMKERLRIFSKNIRSLMPMCYSEKIVGYSRYLNNNKQL